MKLLVWDCNRLRYADRTPSQKPVEIRVHNNPGEAEFRNVTAALVCVEVRDDGRTVVRAARAIERLTPDRTAHIVLVPFAHLSSSVMTDARFPGRAWELLQELAAALGQATHKVDLLSYGWDKDFEIDLRAGGSPGTVVFRSV